MLLVRTAFGEKSLLSPVFPWGQAVFLLRALGGGGALVTECLRKGRSQEDADSGLFMARLGSALALGRGASGVFLGKNLS